MAYQNANAIAVTGGTIANLNSSGTFAHNGGIFYVQSQTTTSLFVIGPPGALGETLHVEGNTYGAIINSGSVRTDYALLVRNRAATIMGLVVYGDGVVHCSHRLVIPVGTDKWA